MDTEDRTALSDADEFDVVTPRGKPVLTGQPPAIHLSRVAPASGPVHAVRHVAQGLRDAIRRVVVDERPAVGLPGTESFEGQMQHGLPHLLAQPLAAGFRAEPGERFDRAERGEVDADQVLHAHRLVVDDHQVQPPEAVADLCAACPDPPEPGPLPIRVVLVQRHRVVKGPRRRRGHPLADRWHQFLQQVVAPSSHSRGVSTCTFSGGYGDAVMAIVGTDATV